MGLLTIWSLLNKKQTNDGVLIHPWCTYMVQSRKKIMHFTPLTVFTKHCAVIVSNALGQEANAQKNYAKTMHTRSVLQPSISRIHALATAKPDMDRQHFSLP